MQKKKKKKHSLKMELMSLSVSIPGWLRETLVTAEQSTTRPNKLTSTCCSSELLSQTEGANNTCKTPSSWTENHSSCSSHFTLPPSSHSQHGPVWFQPLHTAWNQVCRHMWFLQTSNNSFLLLVKPWTLGLSHMWGHFVFNILRLVQSAELSLR